MLLSLLCTFSDCLSGHLSNVTMATVSPPRLSIATAVHLERGWQNKGNPYKCTVMGIQDGREGPP
ncbi:hypothetical protein EYF80_063631 [Liparis tanakae]|uniref:Secreted protein n=1 Tax=Liparis tanakae TaxID=230148 RepID=A0A4Z2ED69_9TELE|nr:hypothetical protein EYF80_063631 [Liparis tanakae]